MAQSVKGFLGKPEDIPRMHIKTLSSAINTCQPYLGNDFQGPQGTSWDLREPPGVSGQSVGLNQGAPSSVQDSASEMKLEGN